MEDNEGKGAGEQPSVQANDRSASVGLAYQSVIQIINANGQSLTEDEVRQREQQYLQRVRRDCGNLEWLRRIRYEDENTPGVSLSSVYTALMTTTAEHDELRSGREGDSHHEARQLSALEVLNRQQHLVLTGAPGSGKSAFVNYVAVCLAGACLADTRPALEDLTEPLPEEDGSAKKYPQAWDHNALLPLRLILRDFATSPHFPEQDETGDAKHVLDFIKAGLTAKGCADYFPFLEACLLAGQALVMFDGLDEVPQAGDRRDRMIACIRAFSGSFSSARILVTCRPYAYEQAVWRIDGFAHAALAEFGPGQIRRFVARWYASREALNDDQRSDRAQALSEKIFSRSEVFTLVKRPLLLTLTSYLDANGYDLPQRRADLYERLLELLIDKWEAARFDAKNPEDARKLEQHSLAEFLHVGVEAIRLVLERLAFEAHACQEQLEDTADIPAEKLSHQLLCLTPPDRRASQRTVDALAISAYLRDRVGILFQRGGDSDVNAVYTFPHRSFQEYLAAAYFRREEKRLFELFAQAECDEWVELAAHLGRTDPDRWREVVLLAGGIKAIKEPGPVWSLVDALYPADATSSDVSEQDAWGLRLAGEIVADNLKREQLSRKNERILARLQSSLPAALRCAELPAVERVQIGDHLADIGDPRLEITAVDAMAFCFVPAGPFFMGSAEDDELAHGDEQAGAGIHNLRYAYWLARFPVTVAQFAQYVDESGVQPRDADRRKGAAKAPVVWIDWDEAMAYCDWLAERWRAKGWLPDGYGVTLPSEPEWEKAARGGERIPTDANTLISPVSEVSQQQGCVSPPLTENPLPQRCYPWGGDFDPERVNCAMTIGRVSTPGAYGGGRSPYGCEEMSGNVWEWTRSCYDAYPYPPDAAGRQARERRGGKAPRVLRGGAFLSGQGDVRCAFRFRSLPDSRDYGDIGFRVVLSPLSLIDETLTDGSLKRL